MEQSADGIAVIMKNVYFNDLTLTAIPDVAAGRHLLNAFLSDVWKPFSWESKLKIIACNELKAIMDKCLGPGPNSILRSAFFTFFRAPYIDQEMAEPESEKRYVNSAFFIEKNGTRIKCTDLGCAVIKQTITMGLCSEEFWANLEHTVIEQTPDTEECHQALCVTQEQHLSSLSVTDWLDMTFNSEPEKSNLSPDEKKVHFRDDHGTDILTAFAAKLVRCPYITEVINSLDWRSTQRCFIDEKQSFEKGNIEICLHWTDKGLRMVVATTAKNKFQAEKIAEYLRQHFDQ